MKVLNKIAMSVYEKNLKLCIGISRRFTMNKTKKLLMYALSPYMLINWAVQNAYEQTVGKRRIAREVANEGTFKYQLAIVAIAKNEGRYIREWITYYKVCTCVDKIYLYDNESDDELVDIIKDFVEDGFVEYIYYPGKNMQLPAYNDAIDKHKNEVKYMAFIDCDEFIVTANENQTILDVMKDLIRCANIGGIGINWALYGSSGEKRIEQGLVIERFLYRGKTMCWQNKHVKTIANPRLIKEYISPHYPLYRLGAWSVASSKKGAVRQHLWSNADIDFSKIRCNHYFCKSKEEFVLKRNRGMADRQKKYDMTKFDQYDLNDVYDDIMLKYVDIIKYCV